MASKRNENIALNLLTANNTLVWDGSYPRRPTAQRWGATRSRIVECTQVVTVVPGMFLLVPTRAWLPRVVWLVRSPADNVPNWVQMVTGEPLGESFPVKG